MKHLIVGLGNPDSQYADTRHNIGFKTLDALASASNVVFTPARYGNIALFKHKGRSLILLKPSTFMNLSGKAVRYWMQKEQIPVDRILIITDDISLPFGKLRIRAKGSDGGHNGLKSIQAEIEGSQYPRMRFGVGNEFHPGQQANYVLSPWSDDEAKTLDARFKIMSEAILSFSSIGLERTMNFFNKK